MNSPKNPWRFGGLGLALDQASQKGLLPDPGQVVANTQDNNQPDTRAYILALGARLIDLGYVRDTPRNRTKNVMDPYLQNSIKKFQRDAGLDIDSWAGPKTWKTLQQLVSFEDEQNPGTWELLEDRAGSLDSPAVLRAVYLRLYVLGFFDWQDKLNLNTDVSLKTNALFCRALDDFLCIARELGLTQARLEPKISIAVMGALFSQDGLVQGISTHPEFMDNPVNKRFLDAIARIELWLVGFGVNVGNPGVRLKKRQAGKTKKKRLTTAQALKAFWKHQPIKKRPRQAVRNTLSKEFFTYLIFLENQEEAQSGTMDKELVNQVYQFSPAKQQALRTKVTQIATSIWDGIKRVIRWISQGIKHLFSKVSSTLKNLARFIAQRARQYFEPVRKAFDIVHRGVVFFKNRVFPGSRPEQMIIYHDKDFDIRLLKNPNGNPRACARILDSLGVESSCFRAACIIIGNLAAIFKQVIIGLTTGFVGWFAALLALTRLGSHLAAIVREVNLVNAFEVNLSQSPFSNPVT